jgi:hypothetical protein
LLCGVALQGILFGTALTVGFGFDWWTLPVTLVCCGILWQFDTKFVASDWVAQGRALCREYGLLPKEGWRGRWKRVGTWMIRCLVAAFIAWSLVVFFQLKLFEPAIIKQWQEGYRSQNRPIVEAVTPRYETLLSDKLQQLQAADQVIVALSAERTQIASIGIPAIADLDRQIANGLERIRTLQAAGDQAEELKNAQRRAVVAEKYGIRLQDGNTGRAGEGTYYNFYRDMAKEYGNVGVTRAADIDAELKVIAALRQQRDAALANTASANRAQVDALEDRLSQARQNRGVLAGEYRALHDGREEWITARVRETAGYVPIPSGIVAKLEALSVIATSNWLIASLIFFSKILVMLLECAGPIAKVMFTSGGLYQMAVALRVHDYAEMEADRRLKWEHWRLMSRGRNHEAIDAMKGAQARRAAEASARDAFQKMMDKAPWMH